MKAIYNLDEPLDSKLQNLPHKLRRSPKAKSLELKLWLVKCIEVQQANGGLTSLGATSEEGAHPQLSSVDSTTEANLGNYALNDSIHAQQAGGFIRSLKRYKIYLLHPDSPQDEPVIVSDESEEEEARPSYPDINQLTDLLVTSFKPEFSKLLASHDFANCLPNALKELPSKFIELSGDIKELKKHAQDMEIELPGDLKEISTKLEIFTSTISSLSSQVAELKNIQWELPAEFQALPSQSIFSVQESSRLWFFQSLLIKFTDTLTVCHIMENAFRSCSNNIWREVVQPCPDRKEKGWKTIYGLIKTRIEYLDQTEKELKIDFNKPLKEQDPLNELNELANKKRKRTGDSTDHSRSTKKHKSSVQHEEEIPRDQQAEATTPHRRSVARHWEWVPSCSVLGALRRVYPVDLRLARVLKQLYSHRFTRQAR
ncbi:hypothetical protein Tco_0628657 [Tanacetum coccineum]|uniref:Uncharacterized protein n=1 Tax=Tanacetum coccineum TaxID=301880 RepID=A0ABQ4WQY5_9ASTR